MDTGRLHRYETLSPFEIKDELIRIAKRASHAPTLAFLNAGRGNPNWIATDARDAFFLLGEFALGECRRTADTAPGLAGTPSMPGIAGRLRRWLAQRRERPGAATLAALPPWGCARFGFDDDAFVHELVDGVVGDNYPVPGRMLRHAEQLVHEYFVAEVCGEPRPRGRFDLFAVEGGTAAACCIFKSLARNRVLERGDRIALGTPIFTPFLELPALEDYGLEAVHLRARQEEGFQFTDADLQPLRDPTLKAFVVVNPGNPTSMALSRETLARIAAIVRERPDLILVTDDVYATFAEGFRSLAGELPHNTIALYSLSKYFGCTGWRLGFVAVHEHCVVDRLIAARSARVRRALDRRYGIVALEPARLRFVDRMLADSRDVAFNHTAGLSPPQQAMMTLLCAVELMDEAKGYRTACKAILARRSHAMAEGLGVEVERGPLYTGYYGLIDFEFWIRRYVGEDLVRWMKKHVHPLDIVFRLAADHGIVLLNGGGFDAPDWSARVSFANLDDAVYDDIGRAVRAVARGYWQAFEASKAKAQRRGRKRAGDGRGEGQGAFGGPGKKAFVRSA
jgi:aspartate 4-decarboxylase